MKMLIPATPGVTYGQVWGKTGVMFFAGLQSLTSLVIDSNPSIFGEFKHYCDGQQHKMKTRERTGEREKQFKSLLI